MSKVAGKSITYGDLGRTLVALGFTRSEAEDFVAFRNRDYQALIVLPVTEPEEKVIARHLLAVQKTVLDKGIVTSDTLHRMLAKAAPANITTATSQPVRTASSSRS